MKKALIHLVLGLASVSAFAGEVIDAKNPCPVPCEPYYSAGEKQFDVFFSGTYINDVISSDDFYGGGVGLNYFFTRNIGIGVSWNLIDSGLLGSTAHDTNVDLILRGPFSTGPEVCSPTAVYVLLGGGVLADGENFAQYGFGAGIEHRVSAGLGLFVEGRYSVIPEIDADYGQFRTGLRVNF